MGGPLSTKRSRIPHTHTPSLLLGRGGARRADASLTHTGVNKDFLQGKLSVTPTRLAGAGGVAADSR